MIMNDGKGEDKQKRQKSEKNKQKQTNILEQDSRLWCVYSHVTFVVLVAYLIEQLVGIFATVGQHM